MPSRMLRRSGASQARSRRRSQWKITSDTWKRSMPVTLRVLFDLNIILDVLQRREPFYGMSARAPACAESSQVVGLVAAHSLTTLFYLVARDQSAAQARVIRGELLRFLAVAAVDGSVIEQALNLPYRDFEDAVQMMA